MKSAIKILYIASALVITGIPTQGATRQHAQDIVVNSPSEFPALAQAGAEAMFLHELGDGRILLYVEDHDGRSLSILDVTDLAAIKLVGHAEIPAAKGPFDFATNLKDDSALIRYREGSRFALIDFSHWKRPSIVDVPEPANATSTEAIGMHALLLISGVDAPMLARPIQTYDVVDTSDLSHPIRLATIPAVYQRVSRSETGTIFLLSPVGITVVRRIRSEQRAFEEENFTN